MCGVASIDSYMLDMVRSLHEHFLFQFTNHCHNEYFCKSNDPMLLLLNSVIWDVGCTP